MATQEKLLKSLEILQNLTAPSNQNVEGGSSKKKEKIHHCITVMEALSNSTIMVASNFQSYLGITIDVLLRLCNDSESDVRMTAEECLNRIIRALSDSNIAKIQVELFKGIKKSESARSLRAALWRFAQLAHNIRPQKGKLYVENLFSEFIKISARSEEQIHETLSNSLSKIMPVLGNFASDIQIKSLLKAFIKNISNQSNTIRRSSANSILYVCINCRKPSAFIAYMLSNILDLLIPVGENSNSHLILGTMTCLKRLLPHIQSQNASEETICNFERPKETDVVPISTDTLLQIYELCLHFISNEDHNIINSALETLNVLLQNITFEFRKCLLNHDGISKSRILTASPSLIKQHSPRSPSQLSVVTSSTSEDIFGESELTESTSSDIDKWIDGSKLSVFNVSYSKPKENLEKSLSTDVKNTLVNASLTDLDIYNYKADESKIHGVKSESIGDDLETVLSDNSSEKSFSYMEDKQLGVSNLKEIFIGTYLDKDVSLIYCARLIAKSFLLTGQSGMYVPDNLVRVSVKNLALSCLASIVNIHPKIFLLYIDKNYTSAKLLNEAISSQQLSDVMIYENHPDPQIRGVLRILIANFIKGELSENDESYDRWLSNNCCFDDLSRYEMKQLTNVFVKGLEDESSTCSRQTLISLNAVLNRIIESSANTYVLPILNVLPSLASNSYWLVKVNLCELISKLPYIIIRDISGSHEFQRKVINNVLFKLLEEDDTRVRSAAASSIVTIIPYLYYEGYKIKEDIVTARAIEHKKKYLSHLCELGDEDSSNWKHFIEGMPFPFSELNKKKSEAVEFSLSKVVTKLFNFLLTTSSKHFIFGCIETLSLLSTAFPTTIYRNAWTCNFCIQSEDQQGNSHVTMDFLNICLYFLSHSVITYDLTCHLNLLNLSSNLYAGYSSFLLKPVTEAETPKKTWSMFSDNKCSKLSEQFLSHLMKLLNIFHCVLDDVIPTHSHSKAMLPNLSATNTLSPIKRRKSDLEKRVTSPIKTPEKEDKEKKDAIKPHTMGSFFHLPHYMMVYEHLKSAYTNYKISLESEACEKFLDLLKQTLYSFSVLMEVGTLVEFHEIAEEMLGYLRFIFALEASVAVECVQQLLKCLFGTNLTAHINEIREETGKVEQNDLFGFYYNISQKPYEDISSHLNSLKRIRKVDYDGDNTLMGYLHRKSVLKSLQTRGSDKVLANYIRIFEPMVIKSLKQYTITSNVKLQCRVLQLLSQLIQLRVNYCLLDSDQIFIGFVLKQFEFIEEGQIPFPSELIPKIFQFLVQLSYSKQHSKSIMSIPKIIQLCDGLLASGQSPITHCIPALRPIVEDIFLTRNKSNTFDMKELETTREVVFSMLLKLSEYHEVLELLVLILNDSKYCTDIPDKWPKWSNQTLQVILPMLKQNKLKLENINVLTALRKLIFALDPFVFDSIDDFLIILFQEPYCQEISRYSYNRWMGKVLILLLILSPLKEETLINKIHELKINFAPESIFTDVVYTADPLNVKNAAEIFQNLSSEMIFFKFLLKILTLASKQCVEAVKDEKVCMVEEVCMFLMYCIFIFQSGSHCKMAKYAISHRNDGRLEEISNNFLKISGQYPLLTLLWCHFLTLLSYSDEEFWNSATFVNVNTPSLNEKVVRTGSIILFCDYLNEDVLEGKQLSWFLKSHINSIIDLINEAPISEFISGIHRNPSTSKLFLNIVVQASFRIEDPVFVRKVLLCLEDIHHNHTGTLLKFILPKLLTVRQICISRLVANLASRKIEFLLTLPVEDVNIQLAKEDLLEIIRQMKNFHLVKKHEALSSLLNKLCASCYGLSPLEFDQERPIHSDDIKQLRIDKKWYLTQVKEKCNEVTTAKETAILLSCLDCNELQEFMQDSNFRKRNLRECIRLGFNLTEKNGTNVKSNTNLFSASVNYLLKEITAVCDKIPSPHEVYSVCGRHPSISEVEFSDNLTTLLADSQFLNLLYDLIPAINVYVETLLHLSSPNIPDSQLEDFIKFGVICLESVNYLIHLDKNNFHVNFIDLAINCVNVIFKLNLSKVFSLTSYISWLCSSINSLYVLVEYLLMDGEPLPSLPKFALKETIENSKTAPAGQACYQLYVLTCWLYQIKGCVVNIPKFILEPIHSIIVSLSRLSLTNSFVLIPLKVWKRSWSPQLVGLYQTQVPLLPIDFLQEIDILEEYIYRITLLGWTSRQQFEETWMCLLSVLCNDFSGQKDPAEIMDIVHASSLAIQAITSLLLQTLYSPILGNTNISKLLHTSRNSDMSVESLSIKKLKDVQDSISKCRGIESEYFKLKDIFNVPNFEKYSSNYSYNQMSVKYLLIATAVVEVTDDCTAVRICKERDTSLERSGLDINSCLQFLLDFYTQLFKQQSTIPIRLLHEAVRSTVEISDLFTDKSQFTWMLEMFLELSKLHTVENELLHQYLVLGICKAAAVLTPDLETYEYIKKLLVQYLKSSFLPSRTACLHGLLYILEGCTLSNITIGGISEEMQIILPCAVEYVQHNLNSFNGILRRSQEHTTLMWSLALFLIENIDEEHMESTFVANTLQTAFTVLHGKITYNLHVILMKGLERLLIVKRNITDKIDIQVLNLALEKMKSDNPSISMLGVQLLLTYMYIDCKEYFEQSASSSSLERSPEHLVQTVDKISAIFEHIKRGYIFEVEILCSTLHSILNDFFSPSDILTKVISEFLSRHQPHPKLLSGVVFEVFARAIEEQQLPLLQDWVVFSLSNFTQSLPVGMATWFLTCFFISASSNKWLRLFFPYVQTRVGRYEYEDRKMLCIAGLDFYRNLTNEKQKTTFIENFNKVKNQPDNLFNDLYSCL